MFNIILALANKRDIPIGDAVNISVTGIVVVMLILALLAILVLLLSKGIRAVESAAKKEAAKKRIPNQPKQKQRSRPSLSALHCPKVQAQAI